MIRPRSGDAQEVQTSLVKVEPAVPVLDYVDSVGNACQRATFEAGPSQITALCTVAVPDHIDVNQDAEFTLIQDVPNEVLIHLLPSRFCPSDAMLDRANEIAGNVTPGYPQVDAIRPWILLMRTLFGIDTAKQWLVTWGSAICAALAHSKSLCAIFGACCTAAFTTASSFSSQRRRPAGINFALRISQYFDRLLGISPKYMARQPKSWHRVSDLV